MDKKGKTMNTYLLRNVPASLWKRLRHLAVDKETSVRELLLTALTEYLGRQTEQK